MRLIPLLLVGCLYVSEEDVENRLDADDDGFVADQFEGTDCDDRDADVFPGAPDEWYDGLDANCDGADDFDQDGDGHRAEGHGGADCDDLDADVHPGAEESLLDGIDSNCVNGDAV